MNLLNAPQMRVNGASQDFGGQRRFFFSAPRSIKRSR